jgi:hypothetical protein
VTGTAINTNQFRYYLFLSKEYVLSSAEILVENWQMLSNLLSLGPKNHATQLLNGWQMPDIYCKKCICSQEPIISTEYRTFYFPIASAEFIIQNFLLFSHYLDHQAQAYLERYTHILLWSLGSDQYGMFLNTILMLLCKRGLEFPKLIGPP